MKSRLKLYGPGIAQALTLLDELSKDIEKIAYGSHEAFTEEVKDKEGIKKILKRGTTKIGTYDYLYTWREAPNVEDILELIRKVDEKLTPTPVRYTITTTELPGELTEFDLREDSAISVLKFLGPSIYKAIKKLDEKTEEIPEIFPTGSLGRGIITIGEFDYSFNWGMYPTVDMILKVIKSIDAVLEGMAGYTITTFGKMKKGDQVPEEAYRQAIRKRAHKVVLRDDRK